MPALRGYEPRLANFFGVESTPLCEAIEFARDQWPLFQLHLVCESPSLVLKYCQQLFSELDWVEVDGSKRDGEPIERSDVRVHISASDKPVPASPSVKNCMVAFFERDDVIAYMLYWAPAACASVLNRLNDEHFLRLGNDIEIWLMLLQQMSQNLESAEENLWQMLLEQFGDDLPNQGLGANLGRLQAWASECLLEKESKPNLPSSSLFERLRRLPWNMSRIVEELLVSELCQFRSNCLTLPHFHESIVRAAKRLRGNARVVRFVQKCLRRETASVAASLLHVMIHDWHPKRLHKMNLVRAYLDGVDWASLRQRSLEYNHCNLNFADLSRTKMHSVSWHYCQANSVSLAGSSGNQIAIRRSHFSNSNLDGACWKAVNLYRSFFRRTSWQKCEIRFAQANRVDFRESSFVQSVWQDCKFIQCNFNECNLFELDASRSSFQACAFIDCIWQNSKFLRANLDEIQLEEACLSYIRMEHASLENANFTGSKADSLTLCNAVLCHSKLADVIWTNCDLRNADLRGVHFHFGSTRCGLVGSPYPSHGTRTGFYTDSLEELYFKEPESVRRAALLDCDLRGANIDGVDFYLVDLRGTKLDPWQRRQASSTGAILSD